MGTPHQRLNFEFPELAARDRRAVDPETVYRDPMDRRLLRIVLVGSHAECAAWYPLHAIMLAKFMRCLRR